MNHALSLVTLLAVTSQALAQTVFVSGRLVPADGAASFVPELSSSHVKLTKAAGTPNQWSYAMDTSKRLLGTIEIKHSVAPAGYSASDLAVRVPYTSTRPLHVFLYAVKAAPSGASDTTRIRELHATLISGDSGERRHEQLFRLHQEARAIAARRLQRIQSQDDFNYFDAQVFLKLLEITVELGRTAQLIVGADVLEVRNFVQNQLRNNTGLLVLTRGTGQTPTAVKQQVQFIDLVEAEHLRLMWAEVTAKTNGGSRPEDCTLYQAFIDTVTGGDYDSGLVTQWDQTKNYNMATLAARALLPCATKVQQAVISGAPEAPARAISIEASAERLKRVETPAMEQSLFRLRQEMRSR